MRSVLSLSAAAALLAVAWMAGEAAYSIRAVRAAAHAELTATRQAVMAIADARAASIEQTAAAELADARRQALAVIDRRAASIERTAARELAATRSEARQVIQETAAPFHQVASQASGAAAELQRVTSTARRTAEQIEPWFDCGSDTEGRDCFQRRAWWLTLKADSLMTDAATAAPRLAASAERSAAAGERAAEAIADTAANARQITKPLPRWIRWVPAAAAAVIAIF